MLTRTISEFLSNREFISVATCDFEGRPNAAPKFLLKIEDNFIFLADYSLSRTWENLQINPKVSLSFVDTDTLCGYQVNGAVQIIDKGKEYDVLWKELKEKEISLSAKRIIEGLRREKKHEMFEISVPDKLAIFKIRIEEVVEISPKGELKREKLKERQEDVR